MTLFAFALHSSAVAILSWGIVNSVFGGAPIDIWIRTQYAGHMQFLTILGVLGTLACMSAAVLHDLTGLKAFHCAKRILLKASMPTEAIIAGVYWSLLLFYPSLILPPSNEGNIGETFSPPDIKVDMALHAVPGLALVLDFFLFETKFNKSVLPLLLGVTASYSCWAEFCASKNGFFPYPFLTLSPLPGRIGIYSAVTVIAWASFTGLNKLHS
ncbi:hypothetical protein CYLTODRAFT_400128 [Cylindrobasidium torrendii FP15055 ss-10]|uniref:FAR-17a/AIG1-like protein n=1 Tax=Cylindrobasidium torrendii FP15055 ss-10 TaxID=1314674 RepID=A0A0D7B553_9AGAR|nr:hypothetical protein CYLTODRAFT_400128 [Cylindrobasidium torrendii FP15055 ss-10]